MLLSVSASFAANLADTTVFHRRISVPFYQVAWDGGPWFTFLSYPVKSDTSITHMHWVEPDCSQKMEQLMLIKSPTKNIDVALVGELWENGDYPSRGELALDWHRDNFGFGAVVPFRDEENVKVGPRYKLGNFWTFLTVEKDVKPMLGVSYTGGIKLELAHGGETWWFRASKNTGKISPELRTKFTKNESFIGFGLKYTP